MIYSLFIFDRHCRCVYFQDWHRRLQSTANGSIAAVPPTPGLPGQPLSNTTSSQIGRMNSLTSSTLFSPSGNTMDTSQTSNPGSGLPVEEEAKLVYGVVYSLRNTVAKLSKTGYTFKLVTLLGMATILHTELRCISCIILQRCLGCVLCCWPTQTLVNAARSSTIFLRGAMWNMLSRTLWHGQVLLILLPLGENRRILCPGSPRCRIWNWMTILSAMSISEVL